MTEPSDRSQRATGRLAPSGRHFANNKDATEPIPEARHWRWRLSGPDVRVEKTADVAELVRIALMRTATDLFGDHRLPPDLHPEAPRPAPDGHANERHAFFLPEDVNVDGWLDHMAVVSPEALGGKGLSRRTLTLLAACPGFWLAGAGDVALVPVQLAEACPWGSDSPSRLWRSLTPFAPPLHRRTPESQIALSLSEAALPAPIAIERLSDVAGYAGRMVDACAFSPTGREAAKRFREDCPQPGELAYWSIAFADPTPGPIVIGALRHFGLGRFAPVSG